MDDLRFWEFAVALLAIFASNPLASAKHSGPNIETIFEIVKFELCFSQASAICPGPAMTSREGG